jgi:hypothetical protein
MRNLRSKEVVDNKLFLEEIHEEKRFWHQVDGWAKKKRQRC